MEHYSDAGSLEHSVYQVYYRNFTVPLQLHVASLTRNFTFLGLSNCQSAMQQPGGSPRFSPLLRTIVHTCNILSATQKNTENVVFWWKSLRTKIYVVFISSFSWSLVPKCQGGVTLLGLSVQMNFQWFLHHLAIRVAMVEDAVVQILKEKFWCQTHIEPLRQTPGPEQLCEC